MAYYLTIKELWRNKGRFFLISLVIALITVLVLFIAALNEGLGNVNKEYLSKLDAQLLVFQANVSRSASASRIDRSKLNDVRRLADVEAAGPLGIANGDLVFTNNRKPLEVSLIGVEASQPGSPPVILGQEILLDRGNDCVIDINVANQRSLQIGDFIKIKTIQGTEEEYFDLRVAGITDSRQYLYNPSVFVPYITWDRIRPQPTAPNTLLPLVSNVIIVKLKNPSQEENVKHLIKTQIREVEVVNIEDGIKALPGYSVQKSTFNTQQTFTLLIGILVIGGFFQIQMLQKVPQTGVLKAIGASNTTVAFAVILQIVLVTTLGVFMGGIVTLALSLALSEGIPVAFNGSAVLLAILSLLAIGPLGGLVSVRLAISVEPLIALGLSS